MPRDVTVTFDDGSSHVYQGAPDNVTPEQVEARALKEFSGRKVTNLSGGKKAEWTKDTDTTLAGEAMGTAKGLADVGLSMASGVAQQIVGVPKHVAQLAESMTSGLSSMTPEQKAVSAKREADPGFIEKLQGILAHPVQTEEGKQLLGNIQDFLSKTGISQLGEAVHGGIASVAGEPAANVAGDVASLGGMKFTGTGSALARTVRTAESTQSKVGRIIENLSGKQSLEKADVGGKVQEAVGKTTSELHGAGKQAYDELERVMPGETPIPLFESVKKANELTSRVIVDPKIKLFADKLSAGKLPFKDIRDIRTEVESHMGGGPEAKNLDRQLRGLSSAITRDISDTADKFSPEARKSSDASRARWAEYKAKQRVLNKYLGREWEGKTEVEVYDKVIKAARNDPRKITEVVGSIKDPGTRQQLAASFLHHMSDTGGNFDGDKMVRMWDAMNPQARKALFSSVGGGYEQNMTKLVKNLRRIKEGHTTLVKELSGIGVTGVLAMLFPGLREAVGAAYIGREAYKFGPKGIEAFLTSPRWVRILAEKAAAVPERAGGLAVVGSQQAQKYTLADQ
jgi:hypothetical protein